ncbi:MAG: hypothetical protein GY844_09275 [Bradyrhizobium sp.]|nr:hypothetical protein [Bradyrhizobium sp.]
MPIFRYFAYVGGALLALLLVVNWYLPPPNIEAAGDSVDRSTIRIHSQRKWPSAVVFDTTAPTIAPPAATVAAAEAPKPAREAYAMAVEPASVAKPAETAKTAKPHARRTRTARASGSHAAPPEPFGFGSGMFAPRRVAFGTRGFWPTSW